MSVSSTRVRFTRALVAALVAVLGVPVAALTMATPAAAAGLPPQDISLTLTVNPIIANGTSTTTLYAQITDSAGQPYNDNDTNSIVEATVTSGDVVFGTTGTGTKTVRMGRSSTDPPGRWMARVRASRTAGANTLTVTAKNLATTGEPPSESIVLNEVAGAVDKATVALSPTHIPADGASTTDVLVTLTDANGNKVAGHSVVLGVSGDTTPSAVTDNGNGTYSGTITASTTPGPEEVTATGGGKSATANLVEFGPPTTLTLTLTPNVLVANGSSTSVAKATLTDAGGNGVANRTVEIKPTGAADGNAPDSQIGAITNNKDGTYSGVITSSTSSDVETYTATVKDTAFAASADLTENPGPVDEVVLTLSKPEVVADGIDSVTAVIRVEDVNNNPVPNAPLTLTAPGSDLNVGTPAYDAQAKVFKAIITSSKTIGANTVTAAVGSKSSSQPLTEVAGQPSSVNVTLSPASIVANGTSTAIATATVRDANTNIVRDTSVVFTVTDGNVTMDGPVTQNANGSFQQTVKSSTSAGLNTITATAAGGPSGSGVLTETAGPASTVELTFEEPIGTPKSTITANGTDTTTAIAAVKDAHGNPVTNEQVTITDAGDITVSAVAFHAASNTYRATVTASTTAGTETITARAVNANKSTTGNVIEKAGPVHTVTLAMSPTSIPADGVSTSKATVTVKDAHNNPITDEVVHVTATGMTGDPLVAAHQGNGVYTATVKSTTTQGDRTVTATATQAQKSATATINQFGAVDSMTVVASPAIVPADGVTTGTLTATLKDASGNPITNAAVGFGTDGNIVIGSTTNQNNGKYTAPFRASTTAGVEKITAAAGKTATTTITEHGPATTVTVSLNPSTVTADGESTSLATVTVTDVGGRPVVNENVVLTSSGDAVPGPTTNKDNGTYTSVITSSITAGTETITATGTKSGKKGTATLTEAPGTATAVTLSLAPSTVPADGTTVSTATITVKDAKGNVVPDETVKLATNGDAVPANDGATTYDAATQTYTGTIKASTTSGVETITATALGTGAYAQSSLTETPGAASAVTLTLSPSTISADGESLSTATARVQDAHGNLVPDSTVAITTDGDTIVGPVTNAGGVHTAQITASTTAEQETITATATGVANPATAVLTEVAGPVSSVVVTLDPASIVANGVSTSTATAAVKDANGNPVTNETVVFTKDAQAVTGAVTNHGNGTYSTTIPSSTVAGAKQIVATATGTGTNGTATLTETAGPLSTLTLSLNPATVVANGTATSLATATASDANGNPITDEVVTIASSGDAAEGAVTNKGDGTYTSTITASTTAGVETLTATATKAGTTATAVLTERAGPVHTVTLTLSPASIVANGTSTSLATATAKDAHNNPVTNAVMAFTTTGDAVLGQTSNKGDGTYTSTITSSKTAGVSTVKATVAAVNKSASATLTETAGPISTFTLSLNPATVVANGTATSLATATAKDANGNPITDEVVTIASNGDAAEGAVTNNGNGTYTSTITASTTAGVETLTATATKAGTTATAVLTETAGPVHTVTLTLSPASIVANGTSTSLATATAKDAHNNPVTNAVMAFTTTGDAALSSTTNKGDGSYTSTITSSKTAGVETIKASVAAVNRSATAALTETAGPATSVVVALNPSTIVADGVSKSVATATVKDANGNLVPSETVTFASSGDAKPGAVANHGNGTYTSTITASKTTGTETITAHATKANKKGTATLTEKVRPGGYWLTAADGGIFTYGSAAFHGSIGGTPLNQPVVGMLATPDKGGYWQVASDGGIFTYGNATFQGSMGGQPLNQPVVGMAGTTDGKGYWLVARDGGIFAFNAPFLGSMGGQPLNQPINGMMADPDGDGYWFVASDGGIFSYNANFYGSLGGTPLAAPVVAMAPVPDGKGYWMVGSNGAVYEFGSASWLGDMRNTGVTDVVGIAPTSSGKGYWLTTAGGDVFAFGDATLFGSPKSAGLQLVSPISGIAGF